MTTDHDLDIEPGLPFKSGPTTASANAAPASQPLRGWSTGKILGQKRALKPSEVWAIPVRLCITRKLGNAALFNVAIDSKQRGRECVKLCMSDVMEGVMLRV